MAKFQNTLYTADNLYVLHGLNSGIEKQAVSILVERLSDDAGLFKDFIAAAALPRRTDIQKVPPEPAVKARLYRLVYSISKKAILLNSEGFPATTRSSIPRLLMV